MTATPISSFAASFFKAGALAMQTQADGSGFWMPVEASTTAPQVDLLFYFLLAVSALFFGLIVGLMIVFTVKYRGKPGDRPGRAPDHNIALELTWSIIPLILVLVIFYFGFQTYLDMAIPPDNAIEIQVTGRKWSWMFTYPNGVVDENLHVPIDKPVKLVLSSDDVIHSLFIPAFRLKRDAVPGRYTKTWFQATKMGEFDIFCAEYCGTEHSGMLAKVVVHDAGGFETWLKNAANFIDRVSPVEAGEKLIKSRGCAQCHTTDGSTFIGPSFKNLFGEAVVFKDGNNAVADENYIRESILEPMKNIVAGYDPVMPTYQGKLNDKEILAIIQLIKSLSDKHKGEVMTAWETEEASENESEERQTEPATAGAGGSDDAASASDAVSDTNDSSGGEK